MSGENMLAQFAHSPLILLVYLAVLIHNYFGINNMDALCIIWTLLDISQWLINCKFNVLYICIFNCFSFRFSCMTILLLGSLVTLSLSL